jgi:hypothetical protein
MTVLTLPRAATSLKVRDALVAKLDPIPVELGHVPMTQQVIGGVATLVPVTAPPFAVLIPLWAADTDDGGWGPRRHQNSKSWVYQVSLYGQRADQLEGMRDKVMEVFLGVDDATGLYVHDLDVARVKIMERELAEDNGQSEPLGSVLPSELRFRLFPTAADTVPVP